MYNIHPADTYAHGGQGMYGLQVHGHVLQTVLDLIRRGKKCLEKDRFSTYPTVHEVTPRLDDGQPLLRGTVEIPRPILKRLHEEEITLTQAATELREVVLPYEWQMLLVAVRMAARRLRESV